jgi:taurine dioxygenase
MSGAHENTVSELKIRPLHPALGAEVTGVDLARPLSPEIFEAIHQAWMQHLVLIFPRQAISDAQQIDFARQFGDLEVHHQDIIRSKSAPEIFSVSNVDDDGKLMDPGHKSVAQISLAQRWHTDSSFRPVPSMGSILHGLEVTAEGGQTWFTNMYNAFDALSEDQRQKIDGRKARHDFGHMATLAPIKPLSASEREAMPPVWQPMVRRHPVTGRKSLFISPIYNNAVEGMADNDAIALIAELAEFAGSDAFVYRHTWSADDIVMWDNRCTMHQVTPYDLGVRRVMHRATVMGDGPVIAG